VVGHRAAADRRPPGPVPVCMTSRRLIGTTRPRACPVHRSIPTRGPATLPSAGRRRTRPNGQVRAVWHPGV